MDFLSQLTLESLRRLILYDFNVHVDNVEDMFVLMFILCFLGKIMCLFGLSVITLKMQDLTAIFICLLSILIIGINDSSSRSSVVG